MGEAGEKRSRRPADGRPDDHFAAWHPRVVQAWSYPAATPPGDAAPEGRTGGQMSAPKIYTFIVGEEEAGERVDSWLAERIPELSRSRVQKALAGGEVLVGGLPAGKPSRRLRGGERVELRFEPPKPLDVAAEDIPIDIVYEDEGLLVVNKAAGMVVHPAPGNESGTLVNALLAHCGDLSGIGGYLRPGIVHRLDARTSGLLVVAKNDEVHIALSRQLMERTVSRIRP